MYDHDEDHATIGRRLLDAPERDARMLEEAIGHFEAALVEDPEDGRALANLLTALLAAGRETEAVARAERHANAGLSSPSVRAENWLGWYYLEKRPNLLRALEHLKRAVTWGGWWGVAHLNYGSALEQTGDLDKALEEYRYALLSGDAHDPAAAHVRMAGIYYGRGLLLNALSSTRRGLFREELAPRGRLRAWSASAEQIESELRAGGIPFPSAETERTWIELEVAQKREGLGVDTTRKLSKVERAWRQHEERCEDEFPLSGPLAEVERLLRDRRTDAALAELTRLRKGGNVLIDDAIGLMSKYGEIAVREKHLPEAIRLLECALEGYASYASGSSNGGEAMSRMRDVERMRSRVDTLKARQ